MTMNQFLDCLFKQMFLSLIVVLCCSNLSFTKPLSQEMPSLSNAANNPQSLGQASQPQGDATQTKENINQKSGVKNSVNGFLNRPVAHNHTARDHESISQESDVTSGVDGFQNRPMAHNRTARDALHPCFSHTEIKWDSCRQENVTEVHCKSQHVACYSALAHGYATPACKTVIGYPQAKFISKCAAVQMGCQCAA